MRDKSDRDEMTGVRVSCAQLRALRDAVGTCPACGTNIQLTYAVLTRQKKEESPS